MGGIKRAQNLIRNIEVSYNPDKDLPEGVQVTWVDMNLLQVAKLLLDEVNELKIENGKLAARLDDMERLVPFI